jgi:flagellar export protein FliJ
MSLDSLRKVRAQAVESLMMELAQISQALARSEERYQTIEAEIRADAESYARQTMQGLTIEALLEWQGRMDAQCATLQQVRHEIDHATASWQRTKVLLVEASQECKLLDRVAEKRQEAVHAAGRRQEQRATDEAARRRPSVGSVSDT